MAYPHTMSAISFPAARDPCGGNCFFGEFCRIHFYKFICIKIKNFEKNVTICINFDCAVVKRLDKTARAE